MQQRQHWRTGLRTDLKAAVKLHNITTDVYPTAAFNIFHNLQRQSSSTSRFVSHPAIGTSSCAPSSKRTAISQWIRFLLCSMQAHASPPTSFHFSSCSCPLIPFHLLYQSYLAAKQYSDAMPCVTVFNFVIVASRPPISHLPSVTPRIVKLTSKFMPFHVRRHENIIKMKSVSS